MECVRLEGAEDTLCDCGHPLVGQSAHVEKAVHRYYGHTRAGANFDCRYKWIPAKHEKIKR